MDAVKMLNEVVRMSHGCTIDCNECPIGIYNNKISVNCGVLRTQHPDKYVEIVEQWSAEHPPKTQADLFFERYPDAPTYDYGLPITRPCEVGFTSEMTCAGNCEKCRKDYWFKPVEG